MVQGRYIYIYIYICMHVYICLLVCRGLDERYFFCTACRGEQRALWSTISGPIGKSKCKSQAVGFCIAGRIYIYRSMYVYISLLSSENRNLRWKRWRIFRRWRRIQAIGHAWSLSCLFSRNCLNKVSPLVCFYWLKMVPPRSFLSLVLPAFMQTMPQVSFQFVSRFVSCEWHSCM